MYIEHEETVNYRNQMCEHLYAIYIQTIILSRHYIIANAGQSVNEPRDARFLPWNRQQGADNANKLTQTISSYPELNNNRFYSYSQTIIKGETFLVKFNKKLVKRIIWNYCFDMFV